MTVLCIQIELTVILFLLLIVNLSSDPGTYISTTTLADGLVIRTVRTYDRDPAIARREGGEGAAAAVQDAIGGANNSSGHSLVYGSGGSDGGGSSAAEDASVARFQIANALMLEAQSLGLDQPSNVVIPTNTSSTTHVRPPDAADSQRRRASSGVSATDLAHLDMSDSEVRRRGYLTTIKEVCNASVEG